MKLTRGIPKGVGTTIGVLLLALMLDGCRKTAPEPLTLSYFRLGWSHSDEFPTAEPLSEKFRRETGIRLKNIPVPENSLDQLDLSRRLLESSAGPDVLGIDLIWSGVLAPDLMDLRPYFEGEMAVLEPSLIPGYTVDGKIVAIPNSMQVGVLEYRADLLREYGYKYPPKTWDELERMASRIQAGERAKGKRDFWGYVWQGAEAEALTCNALEWQVAAGGGRIIEDRGGERTISVNNPAAIRSWQRARHWIGWISPPSVVAYRELDSVNVFDAGGAAFNRVWGGRSITKSGQVRQIYWRKVLPDGKVGYTRIPGGPGGWAGTLGGSGLAVSRNSAHPREAIELARFLIRAHIQATEEEDSATSYQPEVYFHPKVTGRKKQLEEENQAPNGVVSRPSSLTGQRYEQVTRAYTSAVHSVLAGKTGAQEAAAQLEKELIERTGFRAGPPMRVE